MTEYQPGRIYSGVIDGKRRTLLRISEIFGYIDGKYFKSVRDEDVADVRGPLVVLDLNDDVARTITDVLRHTYGMGKIADQIEAQTTPPLQVGWHECVEACGAVRPFWWDGEAFQVSPESSRPILLSVRPVAYLGKGSR